MLVLVNALQGRLGPGVLAHILQYLAQNAAAGRLSVLGEGVGTGAVYLARGRVAHVEVGDVVGVPALAHLLTWEDGRFAFQVGVVPLRTTVDLPADRLLLSLTVDQDGRSAFGGNGVHKPNGAFTPTPLVEPAVVPGLLWAAVAVAGPIGEIFLDDAFEMIGHSPRLLPEDQLGALVHAVAAQFRSAQGRQDFMARAEAVLTHHGYGRVDDDRMEGTG
jgi:hypothetical protein